MRLKRAGVVVGLTWGLAACVTQSVAIFEPRSDGGAADAGPDAAVPSGSTLAVVGFDHSCALDAEGLACWGPNAQSMLGLDNAGGGLRTPLRLADSKPYTAVCVGERHSCALRDDGEIECWGENKFGQLGLGDIAARSKPTPLRTGIAFSQVACGGEASCAVAEDGTLYCWGHNHEGMPGQGDAYNAPDVLKPQKVMLARGVRQVSIGQGHVCAVMNSGALYCWGRNSDHQLGLGPAAEMQLRAPQQVDVGGLVQHVAAGQEHSCAVRRDGKLFCWGTNGSGQLGLGEGAVAQTDVPLQVGTLSDFQEVGANWFHACARRANGILMCWGRNEEGQLGLGDYQPRYTPTRVRGPAAWGAFTVAHFHTCAVDAEQLYCWGQNNQGQSGLGDVDRTNEPTRVALEQAQ